MHLKTIHGRVQYSMNDCQSMTELVKNAVCDGSIMSRIDFSDSHIDGVDMSNLHLVNNNYTKSIFNNVRFNESDMSYSSFNSALFQNCVFTNCSMLLSAFDNVNFTNCSFSGTNLKGVDLLTANFTYCTHKKFILTNESAVVMVDKNGNVFSTRNGDYTHFNPFNGPKSAEIIDCISRC